ncbi:MAG: NPCBM/NEW2 domain-containing protein [Planctomycetota bacterium]
MKWLMVEIKDVSLVILLLLICGGAAFAAGAVVSDVDNNIYTVERIIFDTENCFIFNGITPTSISYNNISGITFSRSFSQTVKSSMKLVTNNGDVIMGKIDNGLKDNIVFYSPLLSKIEFGFNAIKSIEIDSFKIPMADAAEEDTVYLTNGDKDTGVIKALDRERLIIKSSLYNKEATYKLTGICGILFSLAANQNSSAKKELKGLSAAVIYRDGSSMNGSLLCSRSEQVELSTAYGKYPVPFSSVSFIYFTNNRCHYLSDYKPVATKEYAWSFAKDDIFLWPYRRDKSVFMDKGEAKNIFIKSLEYPKGLGVHANSELVYRFGELVAGKSCNDYQTFCATIGLDDAAGGKASVQFLVYLDENKVYESKVFKYGDAPEKITIPLNKAKEIKLIVTDAGDGYVHDRAAWALARVINP